MTTNATRHTIFRTRWGHFGFICRDDSVCRALLPMGKRTAAREALLANQMPYPADIPYEKDLQRGLQQRIIAYFECENIDFSTDPAVDLTGFTNFQQSILRACRRIGLGQIQTYTQLATSTGHAKAARAVGTALARNPIPLIVPCHRVMRTDGGLGGFSAIGGTTTKQRLLLHEQPPGQPTDPTEEPRAMAGSTDDR